MKQVGLLDYGSGNLHSVHRALVAAGAQVTLSANRNELWRLDALVVPGVGAFSACMASLRAIGGDELIREWVAVEKPLLGICVGHQILFTQGKEHGKCTAGIGLYPATVEKMIAKRLPHIGWNTVLAAKDSQLFNGISTQRFYFVHSYAATPNGTAGESTTEHEGVPIVAALENHQICSTQFHPEKSGSAGIQLLRNWLLI